MFISLLESSIKPEILTSKEIPSIWHNLCNGSAQNDVLFRRYERKISKLLPNVVYTSFSWPWPKTSTAVPLRNCNYTVLIMIFHTD